MVSSSTVNNHLPCAGHSTTYLPETSREDGDVATVARVVVLPVVSVRWCTVHGPTRCVQELPPVIDLPAREHPEASSSGNKPAKRDERRPSNSGKASPPGSTTWKRWWNAPMQRWNLISGNGGTTRWQTGLHTILLLARRTMLSTPSTSFHDLVPPSGRKSIEEEVPAVNAGARRHGAGVATGRRKGLSATR
uniref:Uncharacterized protein n=1 Tax=Oryza meridionalis TaxID=40149 RepID=A0A0E0ER82_9ORYZ